MVRARERGDLQNLLREATLRLEIEEHGGTDYPFRIRLKTDNQLRRVIVTLEKTITYSNFKDAVKQRPDQSRKVPLYNEIWGIMSSLGSKFGLWAKHNATLAEEKELQLNPMHKHKLSANGEIILSTMLSFLRENVSEDVTEKTTIGDLHMDGLDLEIMLGECEESVGRSGELTVDLLQPVDDWTLLELARRADGKLKPAHHETT